ncbi:aminotransferase class III-fold pyridoxal phosphate-dependent enzyme [bacterium]|nr:aminotransferase class III-fold pyridoxal phosphate-dependent enzyme [bacterium]
MIPERNTADWRRLDAAHNMHPFTDHAAMNAAGGARIIARGEGARVYDTEGKEYIDGMAGLWCVALGYGRKELASAAARQMEELAYYNAFFMSATPPAIELARILTEDIFPAGHSRVFFASSGSESNDTIARLARLYWQSLGKPHKQVFISREYAYHGSTVFSAAVGGLSGMHGQNVTVPGIEHVMPPYAYKYAGEMSPEEFGLAAAKAVEDRILQIGPENVAAFFGEPIQGAGGVIVPPPTYWPAVAEICRKYDVLLVADEVICGFGRTGEWFGFEREGLTPDFVTLGKAITSGYVPLSAAVVGDRVGDQLERAGKIFHGYTYTGHPVACAVALENLRIMLEEKIVERVRDDIGPYFQRRLVEEFADHPLVGEIRGAGFIAAIELAPKSKGKKFFDPIGQVAPRCVALGFERGVVMRPIRDALAFSPPLIMTHADIDEMIARAKDALDATAREVG